MLKRCTDREREVLYAYLKGEKEYNTFLLADIKKYGFDKECQDVWMDVENGVCTGVYLRFYTNLLVYSKDDRLSHEGMDYILKNYPIFVIMGKSSLLSGTAEQIGLNYRCSSKRLYSLESREYLCRNCGEAVRARVSDVDEIFEFLGSIPQIRGLYTSKEMIRDRIAGEDGIHLLIRREGRIVSHGNSTTGADDTVMIGGVATAPGYRRKGYAACVVSALADMIAAEGKTPCLFADGEAHGFFDRLGFRCLGEWMTLERN